MFRPLSTFVLLGLLTVGASSCKKRCVDCDIEREDNLDLIAVVTGFCGTEDDLDLHEDQLAVEYQCLNCVVQTTQGPIETGMMCGDQAFRDSLEAAIVTPALQQGLVADCALFGDTIIVTCHPQEED